MANNLALHRGMVVSTEDPLQQGRIRVQTITTGEELWAKVNNIPLGAFKVKAVFSVGDSVMYLADDSNSDALVLYLEKSVCIAEQQNAPLQLAFNTENVITLSVDENALTLATSYGQQVTLSADGEIRISASRISMDADQLSLAASNLRVDTQLVNFSGVLKCDALIANSVIAAQYSPGEGNIM